jgi:hypothetical protein
MAGALDRPATSQWLLLEWYPQRRLPALSCRAGDERVGNVFPPAMLGIDIRSASIESIAVS